MLDRIVGEKLLTASAVYGFWPAASDGDDIVCYDAANAAANSCVSTCCGSRRPIADGKPNLSLADFVAPRTALAGGRTDYLGAFAVTAGIGADELARRFETEHDDYTRHHRQGAGRPAGRGVRRVSSRAGAPGLGHPDERLTPEQLIGEAHRGIRPAFGYPACPDHSEKFKLFELLDAAAVGIVAHRARRDDAGRERQRPVLRTPEARVLHRRPARPRSGRQLRAPQRPAGRRGRALAGAEPGVRAGGGWSLVVVARGS